MRSSHASLPVDYVKERKVGEGTYAIVYLGRQISTGKKVAIKDIKVSEFKDGLDMSAIREIKFLQELHNANVIELMDVYASDSNNLNLVLEYLPADLEMIIKEKSIIFNQGDIKAWLLMTLRGLHHCHRHFILHRDLKSSNLLLAPNGELKLADFGLARALGGPRDLMTPTVVTRWYRAPELLLEARHYGMAIDVWSVGVIFAELMLRTPYLPGASDADQIQVTFRALGSPTDKVWPNYKALPAASKIETVYPCPAMSELRNRFLAATDPALDLMNGMLKLNPAARISAEQALQHDFFTLPPVPTKPETLPRIRAAAPEESAEEKERRRQRQMMINAVKARAK